MCCYTMNTCRNIATAETNPVIFCSTVGRRCTLALKGKTFHCFTWTSIDINIWLQLILLSYLHYVYLEFSLITILFSPLYYGFFFLHPKINSQTKYQQRILTEIVAYAIIVYQYIRNLSNNFSSCCEASDIY